MKKGWKSNRVQSRQKQCLCGLSVFLGNVTLWRAPFQQALFLLGLLIFTTACLSKKDYSEAEIQALMDDELNRKLTDYRNNKIKVCAEEALREATRIVDSLLIAEAYYDRDTLTRPPKPVRPDEKAPEIKVPDTIQLKPLFDGKRKKVKMDTLKNG